MIDCIKGGSHVGAIPLIEHLKTSARGGDTEPHVHYHREEGGGRKALLSIKINISINTTVHKFGLYASTYSIK